MNEEKYYKPELSEFHTGFEYEIYVPEKEVWSKEVFYLNESHIDLIKYVSIQDDSTLRRIRVKHLNHDDIINAGWAVSPGNEHGEMFTYGKVFTEYCLWFSSAGITTIFRVTEDRERNGPIFQGTIRNASQLRMIMEMVGI